MFLTVRYDYEMLRYELSGIWFRQLCRLYLSDIKYISLACKSLGIIHTFPQPRFHACNKANGYRDATTLSHLVSAPLEAHILRRLRG